MLLAQKKDERRVGLWHQLDGGAWGAAGGHPLLLDKPQRRYAPPTFEN